MGFLSEGTSFHYTTLELVKECVANSQSYFFQFLQIFPISNINVYQYWFFASCQNLQIHVIKSLFFWQCTHVQSRSSLSMGDICKCKQLFGLFATHFFKHSLGKKTPLHEEFSDILEHLVPICKTFIKNGTSKQAKHAVKCLYINTASTDESVFAGKFLDFISRKFKFK